ncbi:MAG: nicotinate-nucleotide adenylyltransferase [Gammaproteobacteria bacterium]
MIGVFGGTFDPIHLGHLRSGLEVLEALALQEVRYIPCHRPPHRDLPGAAAPHRVAMVHAALAGVAAMKCDERELRREGPSYTVDTLAELREALPAESLSLIVGADAFEAITTWHRWERLIELAHLIVVHRPGWVARVPAGARSLLGDRVAGDPAPLHETPAGRLWFQPVTPLQISATAIRETVRQGRSIRFLVPDAVERYIRENRLYRD